MLTARRKPADRMRYHEISSSGATYTRIGDVYAAPFFIHLRLIPSRAGRFDIPMRDYLRIFR